MGTRKSDDQKQLVRCVLSWRVSMRKCNGYTSKATLRHQQRPRPTTATTATPAFFFFFFLNVPMHAYTYKEERGACVEDGWSVYPTPQCTLDPRLERYHKLRIDACISSLLCFLDPSPTRGLDLDSFLDRHPFPPPTDYTSRKKNHRMRRRKGRKEARGRTTESGDLSLEAVGLVQHARTQIQMLTSLFTVPPAFPQISGSTSGHKAKKTNKQHNK